MTYNIVQVCLEYVASAGGSVVSVKNFHDVTGSKIIAFTSHNSIVTEPWTADVLRVNVRTDFLGQRYLAPIFNADLQEAEKILRQADVIIIHLLYRYYFHWAISIAQKAKIPYWVIPHGGLDPYVFTYRPLQKRLWLLTIGHREMKSAKFVILATKREQEKAYSQLKGVNTVIFKWPVAFIETNRQSELREIIRSRHNIPLEARVLIYLGRLDLMKRPLRVIESLGMVENPYLHLIIVGQDGTVTRQDCEHFFTKHNIKNVHLIGPVYEDERFSYLMASDAYISLSIRENFNYTAAEAMSCGLPVILSPGNDLTEDLREVNCGWMLKTDDILECKGVLNEFISLPRNALEEMGQSAQIWARLELSNSIFRERVLQLVKRSVENTV